jgi:uncharacterized membrane protein YdjX (TVP38/TMEM64 family)
VILLGAVSIVALIAYPAEGFLRVWAVIGTLVGITAGALPAWFFAAAAGRADAERGRSEEKVQTLLAIAEPGLVQEAARLRPELFGQLSAEAGATVPPTAPSEHAASGG